MSTKFFTNQDGNSLLKKFEGVFSNIDSIRHFDALVGYFRTSGYFKLRAFLDKIPKIRILVGINVDQLIKKYHDRGQYFLENPDETKEEFLAEMIKNIQEADYDEVTEKGIIQFIEDLTSGKIELKAHPKKKIHAKVYIFRPANFNQYAPCEVITGSSNLTDAGLGANPDSNYEFNVCSREYDDVKFATDEFERLWSESVPILQAEAGILKQKTHLRDDFTPFELYIKMLIEYFGKRVEYDPYNIELLLPDKFIPLKYQSDAANQGYAIMMKHNGFILADVVGLGKTIVACMIIKKFIYENGTHSKILVVVPPAIESAWRRTVSEFGIRTHFDFITLGSLKKITEPDGTEKYDSADKYDLIVVDESHKFRNESTNMYAELQQIAKMPRSKPAESGDTRKKVILISATPLNNRPQDIENQLYLFQDKRNSTLENVRDLQAYFKPLNKFYDALSQELKNELSPQQKKKVMNKLKALFQKLRDEVIEPLVIRRTRTDIEKNDDYLQDMKSQGIIFPKVDDPTAVYYNLDGKLSKLFYETVSMITSLDEFGSEADGLGYYRYRAIEFLVEQEDRDIYGNVESISGRLSAIMKTLLVKRLESSFYAFTKSIERFQTAINNMINMFEKDRVFVAPDYDINKLLEEGHSYDEIENKINEKGGNNREFNAKAFDKKFVQLLKQDKEKIDYLVEQWQKVKKDPKLDEFAHQIKTEFFESKKNVMGKLVIFSESKETAQELSRYLEKESTYKILTVSADNRKHVENILRDNFDANLEEEKWKNDVDIIITTEVLAEGINLHRSNVVVNYDVPWNSTRLMQRIGRVNRIGSRAEKIYVYNFYPSAHGDAQINLVNNALRKLQAFHTAFGEDNRIFSVLEEMSDSKDGLFGNKIQQEESEILNYLIELRNFRKKHPKRFNEIARIPDKARCGRIASTKVNLTDEEGGPFQLDTAQCSLSYLKSDNHPGIFCLVLPELNIKELNFLQAVKLFKAEETEKPVPLHKQHYEQTIKGLDYFKTEKNQENVQNVSRKSLSTAENKAITNLNEAKKHAPTEQKRMSLTRAMDAIKKGTFVSKGLPKTINDFFTAHNKLLVKETLVFIDRLFIEVLDKYDFSANADDQTESKKETHRGIINRKIVLTQSFV